MRMCAQSPTATVHPQTRRAIWRGHLTGPSAAVEACRMRATREGRRHGGDTAHRAGRRGADPGPLDRSGAGPDHRRRVGRPAVQPGGARPHRGGGRGTPGGGRRVVRRLARLPVPRRRGADGAAAGRRSRADAGGGRGARGRGRASRLPDGGGGQHRGLGANGDRGATRPPARWCWRRTCRGQSRTRSEPRPSGSRLFARGQPRLRHAAQRLEEVAPLRDRESRGPAASSASVRPSGVEP